jgi:hypothetical protein
MCEIREARQTTDEGWNIRCGVEERWILIGQEFCSVFIAILGLIRTRLCLRLVCEIELFASLWVNQRWERSLGCVRGLEGQVLRMVARAIKRS